jgi:hypothetical protein
MTTPEVCSPEAFENFFLAKCYDVISNGQYKKHLVRCKDTGETWAVKMGADVQLVQSCINKVQSAVASMPHMGNHLQEICRSVMNSAQPPVKLYLGVCNCTITNAVCTQSLDLSKTARSSQPTRVSLKFCHFFMMLWLCNKIEYVVRSVCRGWMDGRDSGDTYKDLCEGVKADHAEFIARMHKLFNVAYAHVTRTLEEYRHENSGAPILHMTT